ncbi:MAG TPA: multicopper oxidase domain-containing protein [Mycobacteriales bacterium]|nr:multicopper oxidase domain-containing protein [Mycobacteriales bacterium]
MAGQESTVDDEGTTSPTGMGIVGPPNPLRPDQRLAPFQAPLIPPQAHRLRPESVHEVDIAETTMAIHPDLPPVPAWGFGIEGHITSPGILLEAAAGRETWVRWRNRLPASVHPWDPTQPPARLPIATAVLQDPNGDTDSVQNYLGAQGGTPEDTSSAPIGWTTVHLHGSHSPPDADGFPDNMAATGSDQLSAYPNSYDNLDLGLGKVGEFLWYHDHAMNGTRYHVYSGLAGGYLVRDPRERELDLPTQAQDGEILLVLQDRNLDVVDGELRLLHKTTTATATTTGTAESFGPLTLVDGKLWPRLALRPMVYRLRLLNGSNARTYRLHLVTVRQDADGALVVTPQHDRVLVIGTGGGLLWRGWRLGDDQALTVASSDRIDVLVDLTGLPDGEQLFVVNSAQAPFQGGPIPSSLADLLSDGDRPGRNPYPWVLRLDVDNDAQPPGASGRLFTDTDTAAAVLNPAFQRLVHKDKQPASTGEPEPFPVTGHDHRIILLAETTPPGHLYLHEIIKDPSGKISIQFPGETTSTNYRVEGWMPNDPAPSSSRVSFYDRIALRPRLEQWQVWRFVNTTGDTHPMHIHQSQFQPLNPTGTRLIVTNADGVNLYNPETRTTSAPLIPDPHNLPRTFDPSEVHGWNDVIRVDPGNIVEVAVRFDIPGRYVYHCHILEHEDTEMMRPFVVTVTDMSDGAMSPMAPH